MEALQTREYVVKFKGRTYNQRVELHKSGAFNYGNGTAVYYYDLTLEKQFERHSKNETD